MINDIISYMKKFFLLLVLLIAGASAQNYLWPTDASNLLSSGFCEYRPDHYHSAIDIKTWNTEGYKCFAIEDGTIFRVRVSPFGAGKSLYLRLKDGHIAVYIHLQKFIPPIEEQVRQQQLLTENYRVDLGLNLAVKKGDIIAYTGSTGIGVPHLHFEIRDSKHRPINPLYFYPQVVDKIRPRLLQMAFIPLTPQSTVNQRPFPQVVDLVYQNNGQYKLQQNITANGKIGIAVKGFDQADGAYNKISYFKSSLSVENREIFRCVYDTLDYSTTNWIDHAIYYPLKSSGQGVFFKQYADPGIPLEFFKLKSFSDGSIRINESPVSFVFEAVDFAGNRSFVNGSLQPESYNKIEVIHREFMQGWAYLVFKSARFNRIQFSSAKSDKWAQVDYFEIMKRQNSADGQIVLTKVKLADSLDSRIKISLHTENGNKLNKILEKGKNKKIVTPQFSIHDKMLVWDNPDPGTVFTINQNGKRLSGMVNIDNLSILPASEIESGTLITKVHDNLGKQLVDSLEIFKIVPSESGQMDWYDSTLVLKYSENSIFDTILASVERYPEDSVLSEHFVTSGPIYKIQPSQFGFFKGVELNIKPQLSLSSQNWGLFRVNNNGRLSLASANLDSASGWYRSKLYNFGQFTFVSDTIPPIVNLSSPVSGKTYYVNPKINFICTDSLAGIDHEELISIRINGAFVLPEWDPEEKTVFAKIDTPLPAGSNNLVITVRDNLGNSTQKSINFYISKK